VRAGIEEDDLDLVVEPGGDVDKHAVLEGTGKRASRPEQAQRPGHDLFGGSVLEPRSDGRYLGLRGPVAAQTCTRRTAGPPRCSRSHRSQTRKAPARRASRPASYVRQRVQRGPRRSHAGLRPRPTMGSSRGRWPELASR
jgi:hypothetical protein